MSRSATLTLTLRSMVCSGSSMNPGEDYLLPKKFFRSIALPQAVRKAVLAAAQFRDAWRAPSITSISTSHNFFVCGPKYISSQTTSPH
jgi:hypothetical protein